MPKIIAAMPAFNEAKYIGSLVLQTRKYVDEVIVVDDGSTDDTVEIAKLAGARVIQHEKNSGYGAAIQSIFNEAKKLNPDVLVVLDADSQHHPQEIPTLIKPVLENQNDVVIGSRQEHSKKIPFYRRIGQKIILRSVKTIAEDTLTDSECGFRAFSRQAIQTLNLKEKGMAVSAETVAQAYQKKLKVTQVPVNITYTKDSSTLNPVRHGLGVFARILVMISEQRPLFFFGLGGIIAVLVGLGFGVRVLTLYSESNVLPTGNTLVAVVLIVVGMFSLFTGFILATMQKEKYGRNVFFKILTIMSERHPMVFFGLSGLLMFIVGLGFGIRVLNLYSLYGVVPTGNTLITISLIVIGVFSIFTGFILRALAREKR